MAIRIEITDGCLPYKMLEKQKNTSMFLIVVNQQPVVFSVINEAFVCPESGFQPDIIATDVWVLEGMASGQVCFELTDDMQEAISSEKFKQVKMVIKDGRIYIGSEFNSELTESSYEFYLDLFNDTTSASICINDHEYWIKVTCLPDEDEDVFMDEIEEKLINYSNRRD